jgi:hypothetical protein
MRRRRRRRVMVRRRRRRVWVPICKHSVLAVFDGV